MRKRRPVNGPVQVGLLERACVSRLGMVYVKDYREIRAARALVRRGLLHQPGPHSRHFVHVSVLEADQ